MQTYRFCLVGRNSTASNSISINNKFQWFEGSRRWNMKIRLSWLNSRRDSAFNLIKLLLVCTCLWPTKNFFAQYETRTLANASVFSELQPAWFFHRAWNRNQFQRHEHLDGVDSKPLIWKYTQAVSITLFLCKNLDILIAPRGCEQRLLLPKSNTRGETVKYS